MVRETAIPARFRYLVTGLTPAGDAKMAKVGKRKNARPSKVIDTDEASARKRFACQVNSVFGSDLTAEDVVLS